MSSRVLYGLAGESGAWVRIGQAQARAATALVAETITAKPPMPANTSTKFAADIASVASEFRNFQRVVINHLIIPRYVYPTRVSSIS